MTVRYIVGDTREQTAALPDGSVSLVACSPPFIALRSYLPADHPDKDREIGSEPDPATFLDTLLGLTAEWGRVLAPWGSIAIELGDTYTGAGGYGSPDSPNPAYGGPKTEGHFDGRTIKRFKKADDGWPRAKCLALVPQLYAASLAYGRNLLTGEPSPAGQWLVRNMIVWHRPNPAVGALGDKFRPSTSYITVATRSPKRWFDLSAVRTPVQHPLAVATRNGKSATNDPLVSGRGLGDYDPSQTSGAPPLDAWFDEHDTWTVTTQPSSLAHYAMWPAKLAERLILSMCPAEVCVQCGEPRRRIEQMTRMVNGVVGAPRVAPTRHDAGGSVATGHTQNRFSTSSDTIGWSDCGCGAGFTPGTVLDPFAGTGTTLAVADIHGRDAIGIDIDARNEALYPARRAEVARNLFGSPLPDANQLDLFGATA